MDLEQFNPGNQLLRRIRQPRDMPQPSFGQAGGLGIGEEPKGPLARNDASSCGHLAIFGEHGVMNEIGRGITAALRRRSKRARDMPMQQLAPGWDKLR